MSDRVYLAGPITGSTYEESIAWREEAAVTLNSNGYVVLDPMRGKKSLKGKGLLGSDYQNTILSNKHAIFSRDRADVMSANIILCNLTGATRVSIGTMMELAWAYDNNAYIVVVMEKENVHRHAFVEEVAGVIFPKIENAIAYLTTDY